MTKPRVLIGVPGYNGIVPKAQEAFMAMMLWSGKHLPQYDFAFTLVPKREQFRARNLLITEAQAAQCDYLLMLDDDMLPPKDLLARLLAHGKPVVGALYYQRGGAYHPVIMRETTVAGDLKKFAFVGLYDPILTEPGLHQVDIIGGGCMLFDVSVFDTLQKPYFWWEHNLGTDISICHRLREAGVAIYCDTGLEIPHVDEDGKVITRASIPQAARNIGVAKELLWDDLKAYYGLPEEAMLDAVYGAARDLSRKALWHSQPRETWEDILAYYRQGDDWHVLNLAYWNLQDDPARHFALREMSLLCPQGGTILDYGAGNGLLSAFFAQAGYHVLAYDLADTPTMAFLQWRQRTRGWSTSLLSVPFATAVPLDPPPPVDVALMISVFDHLADPWEAIAWVTRAVKPGGYLILDNWHTQPHADEPQHLCRFDPFYVVKELEHYGWRQDQGTDYLFIKEHPHVGATDPDQYLAHSTA